jgi:hypothetical protein
LVRGGKKLGHSVYVGSAQVHLLGTVLEVRIALTPGDWDTECFFSVTDDYISKIWLSGP